MGRITRETAEMRRATSYYSMLGLAAGSACLSYQWTNRGTSTMDGVVCHATKGPDANVSLSDADGRVKGMLFQSFPYGLPSASDCSPFGTY